LVSREIGRRDVALAVLRVAFVCVALIGAGPRARGAEVALPVPGTGHWSNTRLSKLKRPTLYEPVQIDGRDAVRAESDCTASILLLPLPNADLERTPLLGWDWRVDVALAAHEERSKSGDDFAARVYVMFRFDAERASVWERTEHAVGRRLYGKEVPGDTLIYVWSSREPAGVDWENPYLSGSRILSLGSTQAGQWRTETVDPTADYMRLFGRQPPPLMGVGLMTDADNTCKTAVAYYANFRLLERTAGAAGGPQPRP
jgi:Protein of unknown function (DUF3047)